MNDITIIYWLIAALGFVTFTINIQAIKLRKRVEAIENNE